tara:strand:+ start:264 stop:587 length:324 start_codon:yes stop_codon:yes gene_type:complete
MPIILESEPEDIIERCKTGIIRLDELRKAREEEEPTALLEQLEKEISSLKEDAEQNRFLVSVCLLSAWITITSVILLTGPLTLTRWGMLCLVALPPLAVWKYSYGRK